MIAKKLFNDLPKLVIFKRTMAVDIGGMRKPYHDKSDFFDFKDLVAREPFEQFKAWFDEASKNEKIYEANAMCLSTATSDGIPSSRFCIILLIMTSFVTAGWCCSRSTGPRGSPSSPTTPAGRRGSWTLTPGPPLSSTGSLFRGQ